MTLADELEARRPQIDQIMIQYQMPAMVVAIAKAGAVPHSVVFASPPVPDGAAHGVGPPADALFAVASVTKLATALGVLRLVDDGLLNLDDDLSTWLPGSPSAVANVTLRRILTHTAGLPQEPTIPADHTWDTYYPGFATHPVPGQEFSYSSLGYDLAGVVIQTVSGWPYTKFIRAAVLDPVGAEGYYGWEPRPSIERTGYFANLYNPVALRLQGKPSGGLLATADACVRLVRAYAWPPATLGITVDLLGLARQNHAGNLEVAGNSPWRPRPPWGLGPELRGPSPTKTQYHYTPTAAADTSFGHFGASGSLAWCDPQRNLSWAILSVRTTGPDPWFYPAWRRIGDLIYQAAEAVADA